MSYKKTDFIKTNKEENIKCSRFFDDHASCGKRAYYKLRHSGKGFCKKCYKDSLNKGEIMDKGI